MNYNGRKKFTFRKPNNQGCAKSSFHNPLTDSKASVSGPTQSGLLRPNLHKSNIKVESPSKKLKFCKNSELIEQVDNVDDVMDDLGLDDDFSKDLTIDELNMLEVEATLQTVRKVPSLTEVESAMHSKSLPRIKHESPVHATISPYISDQPEKTLDLFSNRNTFDTTSSIKNRKSEGFVSRDVTKLETELDEYARKVEVMKDSALAKDGEIKMLREGLTKVQEDKSKLMIQLQQMKEGASQKQSESEKLLQREVKRLQTELQFKEKEILEAKEWKNKHEKNRKEPHSPKMSAPKKVKNSPSLPVGRTSPVNKDTIFKQNSFGSSQKKLKLADSDEQGNGTCSCHKGLKRIERQLISKAERNVNTCKEIDVLEGVLLEMTTAQGKSLNVHGYCLSENSKDFSTIAYQLVLQCISKLKGKQKQNIVSILELIDRYIGNLVVSNEKQHQEVDLLCQETVSFVHEKADNHKSHGFNHDGALFTLAGLAVLVAVVKHCTCVQNTFLIAMNKSCGISQIDGSQECASKEFVKREYIPAEVEFPHILVLKEDYSGEAESVGSGGGPPNKTVEYECVNQLDCEPDHLIGKLFQIATSHQSSKQMKGIVFDILVCLSCCCSSIPKSGLVQKFSEHRLLGLLVANGDFNSCASLLVIMKNLAVENGFKNIICFCPDDCPLSALYKVILKRRDEWEVFEWEKIKLETIQTLLTIVSSCPETMKVLLSSECSSELVKSLVIVLFEEYRLLREDVESQVNHQHLLDSKKFLLLRQGMTLLTQVSWNDKQFMDHRMEVEWHYLDLIYGTVRLFRRNPFIHETEGGLCHSVWYIGCPMGLIMTSYPISVIAVQDLRDIDQFEDMEEIDDAPNEVPMDQD